MKLVTRKPPSKQIGIKSVRNTKTLYSASGYELGAEVLSEAFGSGQVWSKAPGGFVWVATGTGYFAVKASTGAVYIRPGEATWSRPLAYAWSPAGSEFTEEVLAA